MKKPIAILKDSLREAWDSKTLLVMLTLAGLFLIVIASIGYKAAEPRKVFEDHLQTLSAAVIRIDHGKIAIPVMSGGPQTLATYTLTQFRAVKEASHAPNGEYEYTFVVRPWGRIAEPKKDDDPDGPKGNAPIDARADGFELAVALWHETGDGQYILIEKDAELNPKKMVLTRPVTDEMVKEFFATELERATQVPIASLERLPDTVPGERVYKVTTAPSTEPRVWPVKFSVLFGVYESDSPLPLGVILYLIQDIVISSVGGMIIILIAVIVTAFFIPNMLRPGSVVMLLSKPINRTTLLLFKYFGGLFFVLILTTFVVGGVWLITGIRAGVWAPGIFAVVPLLTLSFSILYAVSTLAAVWTRNSIVSILVTLAFGGFLWIVGKVEGVAQFYRLQADALAELKKEKEEPEYPMWTKISGGLARTLPRWHDIDRLTGKTVQDSLMTLKQRESQGGAALDKHNPSWGGTIGVTMIWIVGFLGIACWRFSVKDY